MSEFNTLALFVFSENEDLRINYDLCEDEKYFLAKRRDEIFEKMSSIFDCNEKPRTVNEVNCFAETRIASKIECVRPYRIKIFLQLVVIFYGIM